MIRGSKKVPGAPTEARVHLPDDLAPALRQRWEDLLREVDPVRLRGRTRTASERRRTAIKATVNRCVFCHRPGKLGGHHDERSGDVVWVHAKCHRKHHRAHRRTRRGDRWWSARVATLVPTG